MPIKDILEKILNVAGLIVLFLKSHSRSLALILTMILTHPDLAFALSSSGEVHLGRRWYDMNATKSFTVQGQELGITGLVQINDDLPISIGGEYRYYLLNKGDVIPSTSGSVDFNQLSLAVKAWLPEHILQRDFGMPYLKISYTLLSTYNVKFSTDSAGRTLNFDAKGEMNGYQINLGYEKSVDETWSLFGELSIGKERIHWKNVSVTNDAGNSLDLNSKDYDANSTALIVGSKLKF